MANFYSQQFSENPVVRDTISFQAPFPQYETRVKACRIAFPDPTDFASSDVILLGNFHSSDRVLHVYVTADGVLAANSTVDIGFYNADSISIGTVLDADLYASALDLSSAIARVDQFKESTTLGDEDRLKRIWEQLAIGDQTYTEDPGIDVTLAMTLTGNPAPTAAVSFLTVEVVTAVAL